MSAQRFTRAAFCFAGSMIGLETLFLSTMHRQFGHLDWPWFWFAAVRILAISLGVGSIMYFARFRSRRAAALFGSLLGFLAVLGYYYLVVASA